MAAIAGGVILTIPIAEASFWASVAGIYHSPAPKAAQTAQIIARRWRLPTYAKEDLREMEIQGYIMPEQFVHIVGDHLAGVASSSLLEDYALAQQRIVRCVQRLAVINAGRSFAIVSHGRILTALYSHLLGYRLGREAWQSLRMPDLSVINLATWQVEAGFLSDIKREISPSSAE